MADYRVIPEEDTPLCFSLSSIQEENKDALLKKLEIVFSSASCVNSCFLSRLVFTFTAHTQGVRDVAILLVITHAQQNIFF